jgi:hypothetical protein
MAVHLALVVATISASGPSDAVSDTAPDVLRATINAEISADLVCLQAGVLETFPVSLCILPAEHEAVDSWGHCIEESDSPTIYFVPQCDGVLRIDVRQSADLLLAGLIIILMPLMLLAPMARRPGRLSWGRQRAGGRNSF